MVNIFESFKKIFQATTVKKDKEPCPHCQVPPDSLAILKEKGKEKNNQNLQI